MKLSMHFPQPASCHVRINFRGADAGMAEQFLNDPQVGPIVQEMGGEAVAEHVRGHVAVNARTADALFDAQP